MHYTIQYPLEYNAKRRRSHVSTYSVAHCIGTYALSRIKKYTAIILTVVRALGPRESHQQYNSFSVLEISHPRCIDNTRAILKPP